MTATRTIKAEILSIGDEILLGQTVDTNSNWLGAQLHELGFQLIRITAISDRPEDLIRALDESITRSDLILITGGLGPTSDDRTKPTLCQYFGGKLVYDKLVEQQIKNLLSSRNVPLNQRNLDQSLIPDNCTAIKNSQGTAPGMWFEKDDKVLVSMPGVPFEMKEMFSIELAPKLLERFLPIRGRYRMVMTTGLPESYLAEKIADWEQQLPDHIGLAYLPSPGIVKLRLAAFGKPIEQLDQDLRRQADLLMQVIPESIFSQDGTSLEESLAKLLMENELTVASAESCTGGAISSLLTSVPGSSSYYKGSLIAYSYDTKRELLDIDQKILNKYGAVSRPVVSEMAQNARRLLKTDYAVATSGIAGPGGGTKNKPVGTIWIAACSKNQMVSRRFRFGDHRGRNITRTSMAALNMLRLLILEELQASR